MKGTWGVFTDWPIDESQEVYPQLLRCYKPTTRLSHKISTRY